MKTPKVLYNNITEFQNWMLRGFSGPKGLEVTRELRKFYDSELHNFYRSQNIINVFNQEEWNWWDMKCIHTRDMTNGYRIFVKNTWRKETAFDT
jgi:hypothetical protein